MAEKYYSMTELVKLTDNLIASLPTSFYSGIMSVRGGLVITPAANVVARDCYDRLLAENDELRKVRPVQHGRWVFNDELDDMFHCTVCDNVAVRNTFNFCPNCGALMDKDGDEE